ncbi:unnamed protein product [Ambrosiozyma monospora]|uniref:Unnamed protein product n=1 Tax=Ambrosiozyma monospora TaxID=43982 RepID=A0ACB5SZS3_AMBMO|nr:unnamed protein product [Ambrosiozyma monospora]
MDDAKNFKSSLIIYVQRLSELNLKSRLVEVFQELFLDMDEKICGFSKKDLLGVLILSCSRYREVQRVLLQYGDAIGLVDDDLI